MGGKAEANIIGYRHRLSVQMAVCLGPVDAVTSIEVGDKEIFSGYLEGGRLTIDEPDLFGGDEREGGITGDLDVMLGGPSQGVNSYLDGKIPGAISAFRGALTVVLRNMNLGNSWYLKPWKFKVQRVLVDEKGNDQWYLDRAALNPRGTAEVFEGENIYIAVQAGYWNSNVKATIIDLLNFLRDGAGGSVEFKIVAFDSSWPIASDDYIEFFNPTVTDYDTAIAWVQGQSVFPNTAYKADAAANDYINIWLPQKPVGHSETVLFFSDFEVSGLHWTYAGTAFNFALGSREGRIFALGTDFGFGTLLFPDVQHDIVADPDAARIGFAVDTKLVDHDMNVVHIIREVLTCDRWNVRLDESLMGSTWATAADTCYFEGMGLSLSWDKGGTAADFIDYIIGYADAVVYQDRQTGLQEIKLIRDDYVVGNLPVFTDADVIKFVDVHKREPLETVNYVTVSWSDYINNSEGSIGFPNIARAAQVGRVIHKKIDYPFVTVEALASKLCKRDLLALSSTLTTGTAYLTRANTSDLNMGDPFVFSVSKKGLSNKVFRVLDLIDGDGINNSVKIEFVEDKYSLASEAAVTSGGSQWVDPINAPAFVVNSYANEATYFDLIRSRGDSEVDEYLVSNPEGGFLLATGAKPTPDALNMRIKTDFGAGYQDSGYAQFTKTVVARSSLAARALHTKILVDKSTDLTEWQIGDGLLFGDEILRYDGEGGDWSDYFDLDDYFAPADIFGDYKYMNVGRACLDTVLSSTLGGSPIFNYQSFVRAGATEYISGENVSVKLLTVTGKGVLNEAVAPALPVSFKGRANRPYPVGNFRIDGVFEAMFLDAHEITWAHRDRTQQTAATFQDHLVGRIGPETGVKYQLRVLMVDRAGIELGELFNSTIGLRSSFDLIWDNLFRDDYFDKGYFGDHDYFAVKDYFSVGDYFDGADYFLSPHPDTTYFRCELTSWRGDVKNRNPAVLDVIPFLPPFNLTYEDI